MLVRRSQFLFEAHLSGKKQIVSVPANYLLLYIGRFKDLNNKRSQLNFPVVF